MLVSVIRLWRFYYQYRVTPMPFSVHSKQSWHCIYFIARIAFKFCVVFTQHSVIICTSVLYLHHHFTSYLICTGLIRLFCFTSACVNTKLSNTNLPYCRSCCEHYGVNKLASIQTQTLTLEELYIGSWVKKQKTLALSTSN